MKKLLTLTLTAGISISVNANNLLPWDGQSSNTVRTDRNEYRVSINLDPSEVAYTLDGQALTFINVNNGERFSIIEPGEDNYLSYLTQVSFNRNSDVWNRDFVWHTSACVSSRNSQGTSGDDYIEDTIGAACYSRDYAHIFDNMFVETFEGRDYILAYNGDDQIIAGDDVDDIYGGEGNDRLFAGAGDDFVYAGEGDDLIVGGEGNDDLYGEAGDDLYVFSGQFGLDYIFESQSGNDTIRFLDYRARDISVSRVGNDLELYLDADNYIVVRDHYYSDEYAIENIVFAKGRSLQKGRDF